ncbi:MAG: maleylpyruvate isomerase N-terminal domain-containing protein [Acidimicrobiales bacterium]|nr:maleylpyruvate isomerase N-terminal domain-containing protein [Acidimicrobiales bacterium]
MGDVVDDRRDWQGYVELRDRFIDFVGGLDNRSLSTIVPMCPAWSVADVVAHVCGLNADLVGGLRTDLGSDERTGYNVELRRGVSVGEVCREWVGYEDEVRSVLMTLPTMSGRLAADLLVHLHDIQQALGLAIDRQDAALVSTAAVYARRCVDGVGEVLGQSIALEIEGVGTWRPREDLTASGVSLHASAFDFVRSYSGRRSRAQVEALDWQGDPGEILDKAWSPYGGFQPEDVVD